MAEKPKVSEVTSEEDESSGFEENLINSQMKSMVTLMKIAVTTLRAVF